MDFLVSFWKFIVVELTRIGPRTGSRAGALKRSNSIEALNDVDGELDTCQNYDEVYKLTCTAVSIIKEFLNAKKEGNTGFFDNIGFLKYISTESKGF